jgi:hypothetical protein
VAVILYVVGRIGTLRRSGTVTIEIASTEFQAGGGIEQTPTGTWIRYTCAVGGTIHASDDFRRWGDVSAHDPKVCYDPANPVDTSSSAAGSGAASMTEREPGSR